MRWPLHLGLSCRNTRFPTSQPGLSVVSTGGRGPLPHQPFKTGPPLHPWANKQNDSHQKKTQKKLRGWAAKQRGWPVAFVQGRTVITTRGQQSVDT